MTNNVMTTKKQPDALAKSDRADVTEQIALALSGGTPTRLMDLRRQVCETMGVESLPEGKLTRALRKLQDDGRVHRPRRGYYQLVTAPTEDARAIPQQRDQHVEIEPLATATAVSSAEPREPVVEVVIAETAVEVQPTAKAPAAIDAIKPSEPIDPAELIKPTDPVDPAELIKPAEPIKPTEPVDPAELSKPAEPIKPTEPIDPAEPNGWSEQEGFIVGAGLSMSWFVATGMALLLLGSVLGLVLGGVFGIGLVALHRASVRKRRAFDATRHGDTDSDEMSQANLGVVNALKY